ncbi:hypothetical protein G6F40_017536 [Rhizopus arrhizus]|nr:hypothetical protein G6F40_017536 [Rhizopus arrhizus]
MPARGRSDRDHPVAAGFLGLVARGVGGFNQGGCLVLRLGNRGSDADADRDHTALIVLMRDAQFGNCAPDRLRDAHRTLPAGVRQQHHELFAPVARRQVARTAGIFL